MTQQQRPCPHCAGTGIEAPNILKTLREGARPPLKGCDVAARLRISQSAYSRIETAAGRPGGLKWNRHLRELAELFHVSTDAILGREPLPAAKPARPQRPADPRSLARSARAKKEKAAKNRRPRRRL